MKTMYTSNEALLEILAEHGIEIVCNEQMEMTLSDEDAARVPAIVAQYAPAAVGDYAIEDSMYEDRESALAAATAYQSQNGGTITEGKGEDTNDEGRIIGVYEFIAVAQGATEDNPLGDSWVEFAYNYTAL